MERIKIVAIVGPTCVGKSALSIGLARMFGAEIVSVDSMQLYRHMDIGTAKPSPGERALVRHHMIDVVEPDCDYSAADFSEDAALAIEDITGRGRAAFAVGGTGLYLRALLGGGLFDGPGRSRAVREGLEERARLHGGRSLYAELLEVDPVSAGRIHPNNTARVVRALEVYRLSGRPISELQAEHGFEDKRYAALKIGLERDREELYRDIEKRVDRMIDEGLVEETRRLMEMGFSPDLKSMQSLGYREMAEHLLGRATLAESVKALKKNTRNYAKRQMTWFRKDSEIRWFSPEDKTGIIAEVEARGFGAVSNRAANCGHE